MANGNGKNGPVAKFQAAQVSCALWENEIRMNGQAKTVLKATVERRFKDATTGEWRSSGSYSRNEIPLVIHVLQKAYERMLEERTVGAEAVEEESVG